MEGIETTYVGGGYKQEFQAKGDGDGLVRGWGSGRCQSSFWQRPDPAGRYHPSIHCHIKKGGINTEYFQEVFKFTQREQLVSASNAAIQARLHRKDKNYFLWIVNPPEKRGNSIKISDALGEMTFTASHWNEYRLEMDENRFTAQVSARDVLILEFES